MGQRGLADLIRREFSVLPAVVLFVAVLFLSSCDEEPEREIPQCTAESTAVTEEQTQEPPTGEWESEIGWTPFL